MVSRPVRPFLGQLHTRHRGLDTPLDIGTTLHRKDGRFRRAQPHNLEGSGCGLGLGVGEDIAAIGHGHRSRPQGGFLRRCRKGNDQAFELGGFDEGHCRRNRCPDLARRTAGNTHQDQAGSFDLAAAVGAQRLGSFGVEVTVLDSLSNQSVQRAASGPQTVRNQHE